MILIDHLRYVVSAVKLLSLKSNITIEDFDNRFPDGK